jgi:asparagine synthase (glutamine-hydrolysing)
VTAGGEPDPRVLERMVAALAHRGPDGAGTLVEGRFALGHRRLAIVDPSPAGRQPMRTPDGRYALVFNGEVYNHADLRPALEADGARFEGHCDAETVLHHLARHGEAGLRDLRGMFALAFADLHQGSLLLARDRMGIKPLYLTDGVDGFAFASEAKALLAGGFAGGSADPAALNHLLSFYVVPSPWCAFAGVRALRPGEVLRREVDGAVSAEIFADLAYAAGDRSRLDESRARTSVRAALEDAVRSHLMSDVPVGVFLSGGVDSGAVALLAARDADGPVPAFTLAFGPEGADLDEAATAAAVARHGGLDHHVRRVSGGEVLAALPAIVFAMDEPAASAVPNWFVAQLAREHDVKVCLSGLGGDELFAGYARYVHLARRERLFDAWRRAPAPLRAALRSLAGLLPEDSRAAAFARKADLDFGARSYGYKLILDDASKRGLWADADAAGAFPTAREHLLELFAPVRGEHVVNQIAHVDAKTYLANDLLRHMDGMTMAHGVEARVPLLDGPFVDLALALPPELRLRGDVRKYVLREAVRDLFPAGHLERPKMGFSFPMEAWLRSGPLRPVLDATLDEASVRRRGLFRAEAVGALVSAFLGSRPGSSEAGMAELRVWTLAVLELWFRMFLDEGAPRSPDVPVDALLAGR